MLTNIYIFDSEANQKNHLKSNSYKLSHALFQTFKIQPILLILVTKSSTYIITLFFDVFSTCQLKKRW